jgi:hypothetical protein
MKKLFLALTMSIVLLSTSAIATEEKVEEVPVKYEVTIDVTYNAVTADEAAKIQRAALIAHKDACKVEIKSAKGNNGFYIGTATFSGISTE